MNYYDNELNKLITHAKKCGYKFDGKKFIQDQNDFCFVMEVFLQSHTIHEDFGRYYIYKHTFQITKNDFEIILKYSKENNGKVVSFYNDMEFESLYNEIILKYLNIDNNCALFSGSHYDGDVCISNCLYYKYNNDQEVVDLYFQYKNNIESDFPIGFISFYKMTSIDYQNAEDVNLYVNKFMRDN